MRRRSSPGKEATKMKIRSLTVALAITVCATSARPQQTYLYKASLVQAAPGKLLELIDVYKKMWAAEAQVPGDQMAFWMRHSQGDRWDLLILYPMGNYSDYYRAERFSARDQSTEPWRDSLRQDIAWQEDLFAYGPPLEEVSRAFSGAAFYHVEMFQALPGSQAALYKEREMENAYARAVKQPENLIFVRDQGAAWDIFTVGCFRDLKHYAESASVSPQDQDAAAKTAGFASASQIGPYLRRFIALHHDTLAVAVK
jgi:hypothetical protein